MTDQEKTEVKEAVKEAVNEQLPETLAEVLAPMTTHDIRAALNKYRAMVLVSWVIAAVAIGLLYSSIQEQADQNTHANRRQDCILAALIRGVEIRDRADTPLFTAVLGHLDPGAGCPRFVIPSEPPH